MDSDYASQESSTFSHAEDPESDRLRFVQPGDTPTVIADVDDEPTRLRPEGDMHCLSATVLVRIRKCLLDDPVNVDRRVRCQ